EDMGPRFARRVQTLVDSKLGFDAISIFYCGAISAGEAAAGCGGGDHGDLSDWRGGGCGFADYCAGDYQWDAAGFAGAAGGVDLACGPDAGGGGRDTGLAASAGRIAQGAGCGGGGSGTVW